MLIIINLLRLPGRVLPTPTLVYGERESSPIVPRNGVWNMRNLKYVDAKSMSKYGVINTTRCSPQNISYFLDKLRETGLKMGKRFFEQGREDYYFGFPL